eukprot:3477959-Alexandrium_andersonii.AAC.1
MVATDPVGGGQAGTPGGPANCSAHPIESLSSQQCHSPTEIAASGPWGETSASNAGTRGTRQQPCTRDEVRGA